MKNRSNGPQPVGTLLAGLLPHEVKRVAEAMPPKGKGTAGGSRALTRANASLIGAAADIATNPPEGRGVVLHWKSLREQFAQEYTGKDADKDFKKKFVPALKKVLASTRRPR